MKKIILLAILFFPVILFAQNWMPITAVDTYHFAIDSVDFPSHAIWVESVETKNERTIYHLNKVVQPCDTCDYWNYSYYKNPDSVILMSLYDQPQFLNYRVEIDKKGNFWFIDPGVFLIKPYAGINKYWIFDSLNNITAKVIDIKPQTIFGNIDTVKIILLSNFEFIILSKNHGIIQFPELKNKNQNYSLIGIQNRNLGQKLPTLFDIFNFQVGDRFQYLLSYFSQNHGYRTENFKILSKDVQNEKIIYGIDKFHIDGYGSPTNIYFGNTHTYKGPVEYKLNYYGFNPTDILTNNRFIVSDSLLNIYYQIKLTKDNKGELIVIITGSCYNSNIYTCNCYSIDSSLKTKGSEKLLFPNNSFYGAKFEIFKPGHGSIHKFRSNFESTYNTKQIGYIKNGVKHGEILDYNLVSVEDDINNKISISPNPFTKNIVFTSEEDFEMQLIVYDVSGKECLNQPISTNQHLDLSFLEKGTYILKINTEEEVLMKRIIKQ
jgi:hypothetical protein